MALVSNPAHQLERELHTRLWDCELLEFRSLQVNLTEHGVCLRGVVECSPIDDADALITSICRSMIDPDVEIHDQLVICHPE